MEIITSKEMVRLDAESSVKTEILMERAGEGMANFIDKSFPQYPVCFICGSGNNGADGFVAARYLLKRGREVEVYIYGSRNKLKNLPRIQADRLDLEIQELSAGELDFILNPAKIVVDCILGTGFRLPLKKDLKEVLEIINKKSKITLSCDIPTGINGDTGEADDSSINADVTVTFEYPKIGHWKAPGSEFAGSLEVVKIGTGLSPDEYVENTEFTAGQDCESYFTRRPKVSNKKKFGHILVVGGSPGMEGALVMAAQGALRTGAGLVTCACTGQVANTVTSHCLSAMKLILEEESTGCLADNNDEKILDFIQKRQIDCMVLGPGLTTKPGPQRLARKLVEKTGCPIVLDADGINNLCGAQELIKTRKTGMVITPHPGEMAGITHKSVKMVLNNREPVAKDLSNELGCIVVLKGYRTLVTDGKMVYINSSGNPGMATGGSGDVLSGMIASLIGEGYCITDSARIGVWVHGRAGDLAAWRLGERAVLPEDILEKISEV